MHHAASALPDNPIARSIFEQWHRAVVERDLDALTALYAEDATLESPLVFVTGGAGADGSLQGRASIAAFFARGFAQPDNGLGRWYRTGRFHARADQLVWEYPRRTPQGDQVDLVEVMDLDSDGKIAHHRVYWGWKGFQALLAAART